MSNILSNENSLGAAIIAGFGEGLGTETALKLPDQDLKVGIVARTTDKLEQIARKHEGILFPTIAVNMDTRA